MGPPANDGSRDERIHSVDSAIQQRKTLKVLAPEGTEVRVSEAFEASVLDALALAQWAPFHYPGADGSAVPWRFRVLDSEGCRRLAGWVERLADVADVAAAVSGAAGASRASLDRPKLGKIPSLLRGTAMLVLATWKVESPGSASAARVRQQRDQEHLAATAAAVQTFLVAAAARGIESYWSSGGVLTRPEVLTRLGAAPGEALCAAVFVAPPEPAGEVVGGKLRHRRGEVRDWLTRVDPALIRPDS